MWCVDGISRVPDTGSEGGGRGCTGVGHGRVAPEGYRGGGGGAGRGSRGAEAGEAPVQPFCFAGDW